MKFQKGQLVRGVVCGKFVVVKTEVSKSTGLEIVTVNERHPVTNEVSKTKLRLTADILIAE